MKKERATTSDEQRERMLIAEQIERAAAQTEAKGESSDSDKPAVDEGLKRDDNQEKLVLSFSLKPKAPSPESHPDAKSEPTPSTSSSGLKLNPLKAPSTNPLKRPNVFKMATSKSSTSKADGPESALKKREAPLNAAERLMFEDQERKRRKMERETERAR